MLSFFKFAILVNQDSQLKLTLATPLTSINKVDGAHEVGEVDEMVLN